ncbi:DUF1566 domain-containing protein [Paraglaciecola aquimarina]|uniref:DUF1566 domain-containing protein n=1 Tax=Paraglaciecola aquimarina TaxID=1235557 RepID=A0ABU3T0P2_9ALTE|nr:DUF1566 domain-containing protein [Paraglaciecola aquimarina]MDU0355834.1 DUF1566 domain-containing protein [Paraglaciecola aquimarina]
MRLLILGCLFWSFAAMSQTCLVDFDAATQEEEFLDNGDGTATDLSLGLMWMRCSLGQTWQNETCEGDASELSWQQALQAAHGYQYADKLGWRVPNIKELASLTERKCVRPAINELFFPNTPSDDFWTSTPSVMDHERAWVVAFFNSSNSIKDKKLFVFTRLVRNLD